MGEELLKVGAIDEDKYERSKRLGWFKLDKVKKAKVLVVGAGALGNETCKDLVLSGFRNITLVDMDYVVMSNLNRCIFFSDGDARKKRNKAEVVAEKLKMLDESVNVRAFVSKIEDFPDDFIPSHDIVLGCLDNILARLHVNAHSYFHNVPYIDGATRGLIGKVQIVIPPETSCLECGMNSTHNKIRNLRYSCTGRNISFFEPKLAADVNTTSIVSAVQVQEALKIVHGRDNLIKNIFYYDGNRNFSDVMELPINPACPHHDKR
ncbi:MAG: ThiF family adenylyltransferase [Candidatus Thermoplasmatota archaeon]|nr:ThiF family adenylyltransferase [Candidatus Thermoplasmatota archaeon]